VADNKNLVVECDNLVKIYKAKDLEVVALQGLDLSVEKGELTAIIGKSGSGKSTLLNIIAGLERPSAGKVFVDGKDLLKFTDKELKEFNRSSIGFVWQNTARNIIPYLTAQQNVEVPMMITGHKSRSAWAKELLQMVGLGNKRNSRLGELSGGEQQRVAIAISLANSPRLVLADEPTGSVDGRTAHNILEVFSRLNKELGITVVIVTHDMRISKMVNRVISISDGMIGSELFKTDCLSHNIDNSDIQSFISKTHDEFAIVDRKGRMRIPEELMTKMNIKGGQKLTIHENDRGFEVFVDSLSK